MTTLLYILSFIGALSIIATIVLMIVAYKFNQRGRDDD